MRLRKKMEHGMRSKAYEEARKELEPVETKIPRSFKKEEWSILPYEEKLAFVQEKKAAVLAAIQSRLGSPVISLINDLIDLEVRMAGQEGLDKETGNELSDKYLEAVKLKIKLATAIKQLTDKGVIKHQHEIIKKIGDDEVIDVDFEEVVERVIPGGVGSGAKSKDCSMGHGDGRQDGAVLLQGGDSGAKGLREVSEPRQKDKD